MILSSVLTLAAVVPYLRDVWIGKSKPRVVTWLVWTALNLLATAASFSDHQYASVVLTLSESVETMAVVVVGLMRAGSFEIAPFDIVCLIGAAAGLLLWRTLDSPSLAVLATIAVDVVGSLPTIKHMWQLPREETWITYLLSSLSGLAALGAATSIRITEIGAPLDILLMNALFVVIISWRRETMVVSPATFPGETGVAPPLPAGPLPTGLLPAPTGLVAPSPTQVPNLSWQKVPGATGYNVYRDAALITQTSAESFSDTTVTAGSHTYYVTAQTAGRQSAPSGDVAVVVDRIPPTLTCTVDNEPNSSGWHNRPVTVTFIAEDAAVGIASCSPPVSITKDGVDQEVVGHAMNFAGDAATLRVKVNLDQTPPDLGDPVWDTNPITPDQAALLSVPAVDHLSGVVAGEMLGSKDTPLGKGTPLEFSGGTLRAKLTANFHPGEYTFWVRARDAAGNWSEPVAAKLMVVAESNAASLTTA